MKLRRYFYCFALVLWLCDLDPNPVDAQIIPDNSLPTPTDVNPLLGPTFNITGGTPAGINLFHSFRQFSVPNSGIANFINNVPSIQNVIGQVTGGLPSEILGTIQAGGMAPNFNLFLINPNGIFFGENAALNINGSFVASTASAIQFGNQGFFDTSIPNNPSLLTVRPTAFFFNQVRGNISSQANLSVPQNRSLVLLGGDVTLNGSTLSAPNGRIELGGLSNTGSVALNISGDTFSLNFPDNVTRGDFVMNNESGVNVIGQGRGSVAINARNIESSNTSPIRAGIAPFSQSDGSEPGDITLDATGDITLSDTFIFNFVLTRAVGDGGDILIRGNSLNLLASELFTLSDGMGDSGDLIININDQITLQGIVDNSPSQLGNGILPNGEGNAGRVKITAGSLTLSDGALIRNTVLGRGNSGDIEIVVQGKIELNNSTLPTSNSQIRSLVEGSGMGNAGNILITAQSLSLTQGSRIDSSVESGGRGNGGSIRLNISGLVDISGVGFDGGSSGILASTQEDATGDAGSIEINAGQLNISNGSVVSTQTENSSRGGDIRINTSTLNLANGGQLISAAQSEGDAGSIFVNTKESITISGKDLGFNDRFDEEVTDNISANSGFFSESLEMGNAGNINISSPILVLNEEAQVAASSPFSQGGNINLQNLETLNVVNGSSISATTTDGNAGSLRINQGQQAANRINLDSGKLTVEATGSGDSGSLEINAKQVNLNNNSEISASTIFGTGEIISFDNLEVLRVNNSQITSSTADGNAGSLRINQGQQAANRIDLDSGRLTVEATGIGNSGSLEINTKQVNLNNNSVISASTIFGTGEVISFDNLEVLRVNNSQVTSSTADGEAGSLRINQGQQAANRIDLDSGRLTVEATGIGNSGNLEINAKQVNLDNNSEISASTNLGVGGSIELFDIETLDVNNSKVTASTQTGQAGNLNIEASRLVNVNGQNSELAARANLQKGIAGNVNIDTRELNVENSASISASNVDDPNGGDINLQNIEALKVSGGGQIESTTRDGEAGSLRINQGQQAANRIDLDSGKLTVEATGSGDSGNLTVNAKKVNLNNNSEISASTKLGTGGNVVFLGLETLDVNNSKVTASTQTGQAGNLNIEASRLVNVNGQNSELAARANLQKGIAGNVNIDTRELNVENSASISASNVDDPNGGDINLQNIEMLKVSGGGQIESTTRDGEAGSLRINQGQQAANRIDLDSGRLTVEATGIGNSGNLEINAKQVNLDNNSEISASTNLGGGGSIELFDIETLDVNNSKVTASTQTGQAGNLDIKASRLVNVNGQNSELAARANLQKGIAGNVNIDTRELNVEKGASISASNIDDPNGGDVNLQNIEALKVSGGGQIESTTRDGEAGSLRINQGQQAANRIDLDSGKLTVEATGSGDSGNLTVNAKKVNLNNNSEISAPTKSGIGGNVVLLGLETLDVNNSNVTASTKTGEAGNLNIEASRLVQVSDEGSLSVEATDGGNAGTLSIISPIINLYDGAKITVSSLSGQAGNLTISGNQLYLNQGTISAETGKSDEEGANITLNLSDFVRLENESLISAEAFEDADGGNILINTPFLIVEPATGPNGNDIIANAQRGSGGNILINSYGVFGTAERIAISGNQTNDIDASSQFGSPGQVQLNSTIDPNRGVIQLSEEVVDPNKLVAQNPCKQGRGSQFTRTGRGGLPPNPTDDLSSEATQVGLVEPVPFTEATQLSEKTEDSQPIKTKKKQEIIPAQGWVFNEKGEVVLTAYNPTVTAPQRLKFKPEECVNNLQLSENLR